jgi:hypothetical protein
MTSSIRTTGGPFSAAPVARMRRDRVREVLEPGKPVAPVLRRCRAQADQGADRDLASGDGGHRKGKLRGLVVAPGCKAQRVQREPGQESGRRAADPPRPAPSTDRRPARCPPGRHVSGRGRVFARHPRNPSPRARPPMGGRWCGIPRRSAARRPAFCPGSALPQRSQAAPKMNGVSDQQAPQSEKSSSTRAPQFRHSGGNTACSMRLHSHVRPLGLPTGSEQDARTLVPCDPATHVLWMKRLWPGTAPARGCRGRISSTAAPLTRSRKGSRTLTEGLRRPAIVTAFPEFWGEVLPDARCVAPTPVLDLAPAPMTSWCTPWRSTGRTIRWARSCNAAVPLPPTACSSPPPSEGRRCTNCAARWPRPRSPKPAG